jgi:hypothetical protein
MLKQIGSGVVNGAKRGAQGHHDDDSRRHAYQKTAEWIFGSSAFHITVNGQYKVIPGTFRQPLTAGLLFNAA